MSLKIPFSVAPGTTCRRPNLSVFFPTEGIKCSSTVGEARTATAERLQEVQRLAAVNKVDFKGGSVSGTRTAYMFEILSSSTQTGTSKAVSGSKGPNLSRFLLSFILGYHFLQQLVQLSKANCCCYDGQLPFCSLIVLQLTIFCRKVQTCFIIEVKLLLLFFVFVYISIRNRSHNMHILSRVGGGDAVQSK